MCYLLHICLGKLESLTLLWAQRGAEIPPLWLDHYFYLMFILKRMAADDILLNVVLQHHLFARLFMKFSVALFLGISKQLESDITRWKPISWLNQACQSNQKHRRRETIRNLVTLLIPLSLFSSVAACTCLTSAGVYKVHYLWFIYLFRNRGSLSAYPRSKAGWEDLTYSKCKLSIFYCPLCSLGNVSSDKSQQKPQTNSFLPLSFHNL